MKEHWTPSTIAALVVIVGGFILRAMEINAEVWSLTMVAAGFLFGDQFRVTRKQVQDRKNHKEVKDGR